MRFIEKIKREKFQTHLLALGMFVIGTVCDAYGYINVGLEAISYIFHSIFVFFSIAIAITWYSNNKRLLKAARVHLAFLILGIPVIFMTWQYGMYGTFTYTLLFLVVILVLYIKDLCKIVNAYFYDKW